MKRISFVFVLFLIFPVFNFSQTLLLDENFDYETGVLTSLSGWEENPTGSTDIEVHIGSLSYIDYPSAGNKIFIDGGSNRSGVRCNFSPISENGNTVYASFLMEAIDLSDLDSSSKAGDYFFNFQTSTGSASRAYVYIKQSATESKFNIGLAKSSASSLTYSPLDLDSSTTYLIVVSYIFQSGSDEIRLWVNPDLSGPEPDPDLSLTSGTDASDIAYIQFRQRLFSGNINIDGIRVADNWSQAPLPVVEIDATDPLEFGLSQNYPNPFNPGTLIAYSLPDDIHVLIKIYNVLGEEVSTLVNEIKEAGIHKVEFNASGLNSGIYFYKLEAGDIHQVKKMNLIR